MGRKAEDLGALQVSRIRDPGLHFVGGVSGLALQVLPTGARSWILRAQIGAKRRDMGLGGYPDVPLAAARDAARAARDKIRSGIDPIEEARAQRRALVAAASASVTFKEAADAYVAAHAKGWKNPKHLAQWKSTLTTYVHPKLGTLSVADIELAHVLSVLEPIWNEKTETASRVRGRVEAVLDWATARGHRTGLNPARWRGHLDKLLARPAKIAKATHHAALPTSQVSDFMRRLRTVDGQGARALEFAILTAARSGEVRGATWAEIDLAASTWIIPAGRMKAGVEHRVPLSSRAAEILAAQPEGGPTEFVFAGATGRPLSDMTLSAVLRRMEVAAVPHGFRSTFKDWASERTGYANEVSEMALAHTIDSKVEAAYRRGDLFEKRARMMTDWANFCDAPPSGEVVGIRSAQA